MDNETLELKRKIRSMLRLDFILPEDIPEIELYMDQVTQFMDQHLGKNKRSEEDKVLTKTMINNYTRNHLVPPPNKKKYSKEHLIQLIYIYYLKNVLAIGDIQKLVEPLQEEYPSAEKMSEIYEAIYELEKPWYFSIEAETLKAAALVEKKLPEEKNPYLNKMAFIYLLAYDMFSKKRLIENLIDEMVEELEAKKGAEKEEKTAKKPEKKTAKKAVKKPVKKAVAKKAKPVAKAVKPAGRPAKNPAVKQVSGTTGKMPQAKKPAVKKPAGNAPAPKKPAARKNTRRIEE